MGDLPENEPEETRPVPPRPGEAGWSTSGWPNTAYPRNEQQGPAQTTGSSTDQPRWFSSDPAQVAPTDPDGSDSDQPTPAPAPKGPHPATAPQWGADHTGPTFRQEAPAAVPPPILPNTEDFTLSEQGGPPAPVEGRPPEPPQPSILEGGPPPGPTFRQTGTEDLAPSWPDATRPAGGQPGPPEAPISNPIRPEPTTFDPTVTSPSARDSALYGSPPGIPVPPEVESPSGGVSGGVFGQTNYNEQNPADQAPPPSSTPPPPPQAGPEPPDRSVREKLGSVADRFSDAAKVQPLDDSFSLKHLFGSTFDRRSQDDVERELMVGTSTTTPSLTQVKAEWPQPWLFARSLLATGLVFVLFFVGYSATENINLLPGLIIVGSFAMPTAVLIFYFEMNIARNVSIISVLRMVFLGGTASLLFSLLGFGLIDAPWLGATVAGVIEEPAKILAVVLVARQVRHKYILNGMLFGAAIGAGFAAFESAGFALVAALFALDTGDLIESILVRGVLSPFGHVVWTAITAGALWRVKGGDRLSLDHLKDPRFWRILVLTIALHAIWNSPIPSLLYLKYLLLGVVAWSVCFSLLQEGINQIRGEQQAGIS